VAFISFLPRGLRGHDLCFKGGTRAHFPRDLPFQFRPARRGDRLFFSGPLSVLPVRRFSIAKHLLERAPDRSGLGQHRAKFRFAPGEVLGGGSGL
jgi:hypothetical protein